MAVLSPIPTNASKDNVHSFAESVAQKLGFQIGNPLEPFVSRLGGKIIYRDPVISEGRLPESIVVETNNKFTIFLATMTSLARDRFTIAHELGHFFLHFPMVQANSAGAIMRATRWVDESDPTQKRAEWEANWFAAAFLMPSDGFRRHFTARNGNIDALATIFGVSSQAAEIRAKTLGLA